MTSNDPVAQRRHVLDRVFQLFQQADAVEAQEGLDSEAYRVISQETASLVDQYIASTPIVPLSRCPFTGDVFSHSLDTDGLDGLWWNSDSPQRPIENLLPTFFAFTGALKLAPTVEVAPFIAEPGPARPYVSPRLLEYQQIKAVLSTVQVGSHTGYVVTYFADPMLYTESRLSDWGSNWYRYTDESGVSWVNDGPSDDARSFDLAPWIRSGQLLWIRPGDTDLVLHSDLETCPYLDLDGPLENQFVHSGHVWTQAEPLLSDDSEYPFSLDEINQLFKAYQQGG
ncbi:MAG: hypothetical protein PHQ83_00580 [Eubacteriales bacterium]|nr:hypothetical protein [Eubacteriales bacterium]